MSQGVRIQLPPGVAWGLAFSEAAMRLASRRDYAEPVRTALSELLEFSCESLSTLPASAFELRIAETGANGSELEVTVEAHGVDGGAGVDAEAARARTAGLNAICRFAETPPSVATFSIGLG